MGDLLLEPAGLLPSDGTIPRVSKGLLSTLLAFAFMSGCSYGWGGPPDVITGHDGHDPITEPLVEVRPKVTYSDPLVVVQLSPIIDLGIEGGEVFVKAESDDGVVFDAIVNEQPFHVPPGDYKLTTYSRGCDGWCGLLDPAHEYCEIDTTLEPKADYLIWVGNHDECTLE